MTYPFGPGGGERGETTGGFPEERLNDASITARAENDKLNSAY